MMSAYLFPTSCLALFQANNWMTIFIAIVIDGKMVSLLLNIFSDSVYSNDVAPYMGTLGKVQSGLEFSQCSFCGAEQSSIHLSRHIDQT